MSKILLALLLLPTLAIAAPKTLWDLDYRLDSYKENQNKKAYSLHSHATTPSLLTFTDAANAIDVNVQSGEWVIDNLWSTKEDEDLRARVFKRGGVLVPWTAVLQGTIVGSPMHPRQPEHTDGLLSTIKVELANKSPYALRINRMIVTSCGTTGYVDLAKPIVVDPTSTKQASVTISRTEVQRERLIACPWTGGWHTKFYSEYTL
jgi:hypothetical protein